MKPLLMGFLVLTVMFAGILAGHHIAVPKDAAEIRAPGRSADPARRNPATAPPESHDLRSLIRWRRQRESGGVEITSRIERMDSSAIRELMSGLIPSQDQTDLRDILGAAARELFRRDGEKALQWANSLDPAAGRAGILNQMIIAAATESLEIARPWIARYHQEFGKGLSNEFAKAAIAGATARGAEDLIRLRELYGDELGSRFPNGPLPDGFDFNLLITTLPFNSSLRQTVDYWAAKDRDAAWAGIRQSVDANGDQAIHYFGSLFTGIAAVEGDQNAARWIATKLDELSPELRERAISSLLDQEVTQSVSADVVMAALPRDSDRVALAGNLVSPFGNTAAGFGALQTLNSESLQLQALVHAAKVYSRAASRVDHPQARQIADYFNATMDQLNLSQASRENVNSVLHTPQDPYPN